MQINTGQKFRLTADPEDAAGYDVDVPITFTVRGNAVATLVEYADPVTGDIDPKSRWVVSGAPGSTVITVAVPTGAGLPDLTATLAVDVVTAGVATVELVAGEAVEE